MPRTAPGTTEIMVLLEDPRLPYAYSGGTFSELDTSDVRRLKEALARLDRFRFTTVDDHEQLAETLTTRGPGFVFNLCDTGFRNRSALEGHIPALLEILDIPYSGAGPEGLLLCRDKAATSAVATGLGIPIPEQRYLPPGEDGIDLSCFPYPAILKPNLDDGSRTITASSVVDGPGAAAARLRELREQLPGRPWLLQEFLSGTEYCVGLVGNPEAGFQTLPVNEVDYEGLDPELPPILANGFKTDPDSRYWQQIRYRPAALEPEAVAELIDWSHRLFARLGCRDYARFDFRADDRGRIRLLEVNPNPAWVFEGGLHSMASTAGYDYPAFLELLLEAALSRFGVGPEPLRWRPEPAA